MEEGLEEVEEEEDRRLWGLANGIAEDRLEGGQAHSHSFRLMGDVSP